MKPSPARSILLAVLVPLLCGVHSARAQVAAPIYNEGYLVSIFPAGGQRGTSVVVELNGANLGYFPGAKDVLIDGPPGITVKDIKQLTNDRAVQATFDIALDATPGRRCVRVLNERSGLTNMLYFTVGRTPEAIEAEPNNELQKPQAVPLPVVVNGRVDPQADVDCYAFDLAAGQKVVAAVLAHAIDSHGQYKDYGFVDATLQILDSQGSVVGEAGDTFGLDPVVEFTAPAAGRYTARIALESYTGFPQAVYRLVLDEMLATSVFPAGGQRGTTVDAELTGPNIPPGMRQQVVVTADDAMPLQYVLTDATGIAELELPFLRGRDPEVLEAEPNDAAAQAMPITVPVTANGRINAVGDEDWYRVSLAAGQAVRLETTAHRMLRAPIDTLITVFDAAGKQLAENDDGFAIDYISMYDYRSMDSRLVFTAPAAGDFFFRVSDQAGSFGSRAVYRLSVAPAQPDFALWLHPDDVPVWGPGSTSAMVVKVNRLDGLNGDIKITLDGLPPGWVGSETIAAGPASAVPIPYPSLHHFLTITAPPDAAVCDHIPLKIVGRAEVNGQTIERLAQPLTLYYTSDVGLFRMTPVARAAVAKAQTPWLATDLKEITVAPKGKFEIPVTVHNAGELKTLDLTAQLATSGVACALSSPQGIGIEGGKAVVPVTLPDHIMPGRYSIVVSLRWGSDIRVGMPGPCTQLIRLNVEQPQAQTR